MSVPGSSSSGPVDRDLQRLRGGVLGIVFLTNLAGGLLMFLYFSVIDISSLQRMRFIQSWQTLVLSIVPAVLAGLFCRSYSRPLFEYLEVLSRPGFRPLEEDSGGGRIIHLRRRALRLPLFFALSSLLGWAVMGLLIIARVLATGRSLTVEEPLSSLAASGQAATLLSEGLYQAGSSFHRQWLNVVNSAKGMGLSLLVGGMVSAVIFFVVESMWQNELPGFFPGSRLTAVRDRWILPVRYRLIAIFVLVGTVPLIMLGALSYQRASAMVYMDPEEVLGNLLLFNLFTVLIGVGLAVLLSVYVARSVSEPLERLRRAIDGVGAGDLSISVPVRANDELGRVAEGFNEMVISLADKEASIQSLTQGLENKVRERTRELEEVIREKEATQAQLVQSEKMASLGQLVAGVAHEINNPVGYIYANTDHIERYLQKLAAAFESGDRAEAARLLAKLERVIASTREGARRAKEIVAGLRTFARKDPPDRGLVDLHEALETALMLLGHELKKGIEVIRDYGEIPLVTANPGELSQVFLNIIANAIQAMPGGGRLTIRTEKRANKVVTAITDTGGGIAPENLGRLFEPFFTTKEVGQGTGLGLAITYGMVKAHGGEIEVKSEPGRGATFEVILPAGDQD